MPLSNVAVKEFEHKFGLEYQGSQLLMNTCQERHGLVGDAYEWPFLGRITTQLRGPFCSVVPTQIPDYRKVITTFEDRTASTCTDKFEQAQVFADDVSANATQHGEALGRRVDQTKIDAMDLAAGTTIPDGGTNMTLAKLTEISFEFNRQNVPTENRTLLIHASQLQSLLGDTTITSIDFATVKALVSGSINQFMGLRFIMMGDRPEEGGLPLAGAIRSTFAWDLQAMGLAFSLDPHTEIEWTVERQAWLIVSRMRLGASVLKAEGVIKIECDET